MSDDTTEYFELVKSLGFDFQIENQQHDTEDGSHPQENASNELIPDQEEDASPALAKPPEPATSRNSSPSNMPSDQQDIMIASPTTHTTSEAPSVTPDWNAPPMPGKMLAMAPRPFVAGSPTIHKSCHNNCIDSEVAKITNECTRSVKRMKVTEHDALLRHHWANEGKKEWRALCEPYQRNEAIISDDVAKRLKKDFEMKEIDGQGRTRKVLEPVAMNWSQLPQQVQLYQHKGKFYKNASTIAVKKDISNNYVKKKKCKNQSVSDVITNFRSKLACLREGRKMRPVTDESVAFEEGAADFEKTLHDLETGSFCNQGGNNEVQSARAKFSIDMIKGMWRALTAKPPPDGTALAGNPSQGSDSSKGSGKGGDEDKRDEKQHENDESDGKNSGNDEKPSGSVGGAPGARLQYDADNESTASTEWEESDENSDEEESGCSDDDDDDSNDGHDGHGLPVSSASSLPDLLCFRYTKETRATPTAHASSQARYAVVGNTLTQSIDFADRKDQRPTAVGSIVSKPVLRIKEANSCKPLKRIDETSAIKQDAQLASQGIHSILASICEHSASKKNWQHCMLKTNTGWQIKARPRDDLLKEQVEVMLKRESCEYRTQGYLAPGFQISLACLENNDPVVAAPQPTCFHSESSLTSTEAVNAHLRQLICEWSCQVVDQLGLSREVVSVSVNLLDRFLATRRADKRECLLASLTALSLAIKLGVRGVRFPMAFFSELTCNGFTVSQIASMEMSILSTLSWHICPPTANCFVEHLIRLLPYQLLHHDVDVSNLVCRNARYLIDLSVRDYAFIVHRPSEVALAALLNAMEDLSFPSNIVTEFTSQVKRSVSLDATSDSIEKCRAHLRVLYQQASSYPDPKRAQGSPHVRKTVSMWEQHLLNAQESKALLQHLRDRPRVYNKILSFICQQESSSKILKIAQSLSVDTEQQDTNDFADNFYLHVPVTKTAQELLLDMKALECVIMIAKELHVKRHLYALKLDLEAEHATSTWHDPRLAVKSA